MSEPKQVPVSGIDDIFNALQCTKPRPVPLEYYSRTFEIFETVPVKLARNINVRGELYKKGERAFLTLTHDKMSYVLLPWKEAYHAMTLVGGNPVEGEDFEF